MNLGSSWRRWLAAFLLAMAAAHIIVTWRERTPIARGYADFSAFYSIGWMARHGLGRQLYDRREQWRVQQELFPQAEIRQGPIPIVRPPFEALVFLPFSYFAYPAALALWSALKLALLWLTLPILAGESPFLQSYPAWLETILCLGFFPAFLDFYLGQDAVFLLFFVVLAFRSLCHGRDSAAGLFLGLGLFKFHLVVPIVLVLVLIGRWRVLRGFMPTAVGLTAISCAVAGGSVIFAYPAYLLRLNRAPGVGMVTAQSMPNLRGLLTAWVGRAPYPGPIHWLLLPVAIAALAYTARIWRSRIEAGMPALALGYSLAIVVAMVTSYYLYIYDLTLLLVPLLLVAGSHPEQFGFIPRSRQLLNAGSLFLICAPLCWALILYWDRGYLLCLPMVLLAAGLVGALRALAPRPS